MGPATVRQSGSSKPSAETKGIERGEHEEVDNDSTKYRLVATAGDADTRTPGPNVPYVRVFQDGSSTEPHAGLHPNGEETGDQRWADGESLTTAADAARALEDAAGDPEGQAAILLV